MTQNDVAGALNVLYPDGIPDSDMDLNIPSPVDWKSFGEWYIGEQKPTKSEFEAAVIEARDRAAQTAALSAARSEMAAIFNDLPEETRSKFWSVRVGINAALEAGDLGEAKRALEDLMAESEKEVTAKESLLSLFPIRKY